MNEPQQEETKLQRQSRLAKARRQKNAALALERLNNLPTPEREAEIAKKRRQSAKSSARHREKKRKQIEEEEQLQRQQQVAMWFLQTSAPKTPRSSAPKTPRSVRAAALDTLASATKESKANVELRSRLEENRRLAEERNEEGRRLAEERNEESRRQAQAQIHEENMALAKVQEAALKYLTADEERELAAPKNYLTTEEEDEKREVAAPNNLFDAPTNAEAEMNFDQRVTTVQFAGGLTLHPEPIGQGDPFQFDATDNGVRMLDDSSINTDTSEYLLSLCQKEQVKSLPADFMKLVRKEAWISEIRSKKYAFLLVALLGKRHIFLDLSKKTLQALHYKVACIVGNTNGDSVDAFRAHHEDKPSNVEALKEFAHLVLANMPGHAS